MRLPMRPGKARTLCRILAFAAAALLPGLVQAEVALTDLKGRSVTLQRPARHIVVDDARTILALAFLTDDPVGLLAGWPHDVDRFGQELYRTYRNRFPALDGLPRSASNTQDMLVEQVMTTKPDLLVLSLYSHSTDQQIEQLKQAGIATVFVDFVADPLADTDRSLAILGRAIGREAQARDVVAYREGQRRMVLNRLAAVPEAGVPRVFLEAHASVDEPCCNSPGTGSIGTFIDVLKARNIGDILARKPFGQISLEDVIRSRPEVYIATGGEYMVKRGGLLIGPGFEAGATQASLSRLLARPGFSTFPAIQNGDVHGLSQQLFNSPLDLLAFELIAKWTHPEIFADLDVEATRRKLDGLMAVPLAGKYWTD